MSRTPGPRVYRLRTVPLRRWRGVVALLAVLLAGGLVLLPAASAAVAGSAGVPATDPVTSVQGRPATAATTDVAPPSQTTAPDPGSTPSASATGTGAPGGVAPAPGGTAHPTTVVPTTATPTENPTDTATTSGSPTSDQTTVPATASALSSSSVSWPMVVAALATLLVVGFVLVRLGRDQSSPLTTPERHAVDGDDDTAAGAEVKAAASAAATVYLLTQVGEAMLDARYAVGQITETLQDIAVANDLAGTEIVALPTALFVSSRAGDELATRAVSAGGRPLALYQVEELSRVVSKARHGELDPATGVTRVAQIRALPAPFSPLQQFIGYILMSVGISTLLGAALADLLVGAALGALVGGMRLAATRLRHELGVFVTFGSAFVVAVVVLLLGRSSSLQLAVVPAVVAPLVAFLPGTLLTTSVIELSTGAMVAGAGRLAAGGMQLLLLALGTTSAVALVGMPSIPITSQGHPLGALVPWVGVGVFGLGVVLNRCARMASLGWILLVLYAAYAAQVLGGLFLGGVLSAFVGALVMAPVGGLVALQRTGPPTMVTFLPAFWLLVPGALGLLGVATLVSGDSTGLTTLITTTATMVAIALGVLLGQALVDAYNRAKQPPHHHHEPTVEAGATS